MRETAREQGVCTQMGNQGTADPGFRRGVEFIRAGAIGEVQEVHVWTNRPFKYWKQAPDIVARPTETPGFPTHVHWDLFLGPAPERPYHPVYHPHNWRGWWDFGTGSLGDMACHTTNLPFMALASSACPRASRPRAARSTPRPTRPGRPSPTSSPPAATCRRSSSPGTKAPRDGERNLPDADLFPEAFKPSDSGSLLIGSKGQDVLAQRLRRGADALPECAVQGLQGPRADVGPHRREATRTTTRSTNGSRPSARASRPDALSNFDYASVLTESMLLGNVAVRSGEAFDYDPAAGHIINSSTASQYLKPYFRKGWESSEAVGGQPGLRVASRDDYDARGAPVFAIPRRPGRGNGLRMCQTLM